VFVFVCQLFLISLLPPSLSLFLSSRSASTSRFPIGPEQESVPIGELQQQQQQHGTGQWDANECADIILYHQEKGCGRGKGEPMVSAVAAPRNIAKSGTQKNWVPKNPKQKI